MRICEKTCRCSVQHTGFRCDKLNLLILVSRRVSGLMMGICHPDNILDVFDYRYARGPHYDSYIPLTMI